MVITHAEENKNEANAPGYLTRKRGVSQKYPRGKNEPLCEQDLAIFDLYVSDSSQWALR